MNLENVNHPHSSDEYIFKTKGSGLEFVGDFDGLYSHDDNPWDQSGDIGEMGNYYHHNRNRLITQLKKLNPQYLLEVGCGLGYSTKILQKAFPSTAITGMDVSHIAIRKAPILFPDLNFIQGDICSSQTLPLIKYDIIILSQLLWYVLENLDLVFENCHSLLQPEGVLIISQSFMKTPQKYGAHICNGFAGLMGYIEGFGNLFELHSADLDDGKEFLHKDGLVLLRKLET